MIVRGCHKIVFRYSLDVLKMSLILPLVESTSLVIQVHKHTILVAQLVHDVMIRFVRPVHKDRFKRRLWLLLEHLHNVFWLQVLSPCRLNHVLRRRKDFECFASCVSGQSLNILLWVRLEQILFIDARCMWSK